MPKRRLRFAAAWSLAFISLLAASGALIREAETLYRNDSPTVSTQNLGNLFVQITGSLKRVEMDLEATNETDFSLTFKLPVTRKTDWMIFGTGDWRFLPPLQVFQPYGEPTHAMSKVKYDEVGHSVGFGAQLQGSLSPFKPGSQLCNSIGSGFACSQYRLGDEMYVSVLLRRLKPFVVYDAGEVAGGLGRVGCFRNRNDPGITTPYLGTSKELPESCSVTVDMPILRSGYAVDMVSGLRDAASIADQQRLHFQSGLQVNRSEPIFDAASSTGFNELTLPDLTFKGSNPAELGRVRNNLFLSGVFLGIAGATVSTALTLAASLVVRKPWES